MSLPSTLFLKALKGQNHTGKLPIWMMRQAGRYHHHYQNLRRRYSFRELCLIPELTCQTTLGPIDDFDFDAAIIFSDILFALEACGVDVDYPDQGPELAFHVHSESDISKLKKPSPFFFNFQREGCRLIRKSLPLSKSLIGFCGAPWTLFVFLTQGTHKSTGERALSLYRQGVFKSVAPLLETACFFSLRAQSEGGADALQIFDTAAGLLSSQDYSGHAFESHERLLRKAQLLTPHILFFAKGIDPSYTSIRRLSFQTLSVDERWNLDVAFEFVGPRRSIQGNFPPERLFESQSKLAYEVVKKYKKFSHHPRLIANLGHGILPKTPEKNIRTFIEAIRNLDESHVRPHERYY